MRDTGSKELPCSLSHSARRLDGRADWWTATPKSKHGGLAPAVCSYASYFALCFILQQLPLLQHGPLSQQFFAVANPEAMVMAASAAMLKTTFVILLIAILLYRFDFDL